MKSNIYGIILLMILIIVIIIFLKNWTFQFNSILDGIKLTTIDKTHSATVNV